MFWFIYDVGDIFLLRFHTWVDVNTYVIYDVLIMLLKTLHALEMSWFANMLSFFDSYHAICDIYMDLRHASIVKLVYTCYGLDEHAFNAMNLHNVMSSMMFGV
jgi:hypothetical protein